MAITDTFARHDDAKPVLHAIYRRGANTTAGRTAGQNQNRCTVQRFIGSNGPENLKSIDLRHLNIQQDNIEEFLSSADREKPLIVYCYHGNASQGAADYFSEQGFVEVYSMDGGYEAWRTRS